MLDLLFLLSAALCLGDRLGGISAPVIDLSSMSEKPESGLLPVIETSHEALHTPAPVRPVVGGGCCLLARHLVRVRRAGRGRLTDSS